MLESGALSAKVDVYSFGVLTWQMFTCQRPWLGLNFAQLVEAVVAGKQKPAFPFFVPTRLLDLANKCLAYQPEDRPSMSAVIEVGRLRYLQVVSFGSPDLSHSRRSLAWRTRSRRCRTSWRA